MGKDSVRCMDFYDYELTVEALFFTHTNAKHIVLAVWPGQKRAYILFHYLKIIDAKVEIHHLHGIATQNIVWHSYALAMHKYG